MTLLKYKALFFICGIDTTCILSFQKKNLLDKWNLEASPFSYQVTNIKNYDSHSKSIRLSCNSAISSYWRVVRNYQIYVAEIKLWTLALLQKYVVISHRFNQINHVKYFVYRNKLPIKYHYRSMLCFRISLKEPFYGHFLSYIIVNSHIMHNTMYISFIIIRVME